jgi:hypothetical protein
LSIGDLHPALGHQKIRVRVKIDPVPEGLDDGDRRFIENWVEFQPKKKK